MVSTSALFTRPVGVRFPDQACFIIRCIDLVLNIRHCLDLCLSDDTLKAVGPFYLVSMPGEVKYPTSLHWKCVTCRGLEGSREGILYDEIYIMIIEK